MEKSILLPQDSEDSNGSQESEQSSQDSQSSEAMQSSQEEIEQIDPWDQIHGDVLNRHEARLNALINEYEQNGDSPDVARVKADNAMLPVDIKELRNVLLEYLQWVHAILPSANRYKRKKTSRSQRNMSSLNRQNSPLISGNSC